MTKNKSFTLHATMIATLVALGAMSLSAMQNSGVSYSHYRFKVDAVYGSSAAAMEITEFALFCNGDNVTLHRLANTSCATGGSTPVAGEGPGKAVDGRMNTKFCDTRGKPSSGYTDKVWLQLDYSAPLHVTAYAWAAGIDDAGVGAYCRSPKNFRLQGSNDGTSWVDLDVQTGFAPPGAAKKWTAQFPLGGYSTGAWYSRYRFKVDAVYGRSDAAAMQIAELALLCDGENVTRHRLASTSCATGGTGPSASEGPGKAVDGQAGTKFCDPRGASNSTYKDKVWCQLNYSAPLRVTAYAWETANDCTALDSYCRSPKNFRLQGSNDGETWIDLDVQTGFTPPRQTYKWTAPIPLSGSGPVDLGGYATDAKWFRLTLLQAQSNAAGGVQLAEFRLFDAAGNRVNANLSAVAAETAPASLAAGEAMVSEPVDATSHGNVAALFDGDNATKYSCLCTLDSVRRIAVSLRLPANAADVAGYYFTAANDASTNGGMNPVRWRLEASYDGMAWTTLDERMEATTINVNSFHYNAGIPYRFQCAVPNDGTLTVGAFDADVASGAPFSAAGLTVKKVGSGSYAYAGGVPSAVSVEAGSLALCPAFTDFRFKVEALQPDAVSATGAEVGELVLVGGRTNVLSGGAVAVSHGAWVTNATGTAIVSGTSPSSVIDGWTTNSWFDANLSPLDSHYPFFDQCYAWITLPSPTRVTQYAWSTSLEGFATGSACRSPSRFRLQGSNGGGTWTDLDVRDGFSALATANSWTELFNCPGSASGTTSAKWCRLTLMGVKGGNDGIQISEFALYDRLGNRVNSGLSAVAQGTAATALAPGQVTADAANQLSKNTGERVAYLFDGDLTRKFGNYTAYGAKFPRLSDPTSWVTITLRLADNAPDVFGYAFATANDVAARDPADWKIEVSADGVTWTTIDERRSFQMTSSRKKWVPTFWVPFQTGNDTSNRILEDVRVASGASLSIGDDDVQIGGLTIDCATGAGSIDRFNAAETGEIRLVNASGVTIGGGWAAPLDIGTADNLANLSNWTVVKDGQLYDAKVKFSDGQLVLTRAGLLIILK